MLSQFKQDNKDVNIVIIDKNLDEKQKVLIDYVRGFASALGHKDQIYVVKDEKDAPKAEKAIDVKDTVSIRECSKVVLKNSLNDAKAHSGDYTRKEEQDTVQSYKQKIVCYTCITGRYDSLKQPLVKSDGIDYVCFTDRPDLYKESSIWKIIKLPQELDYLSNVKKQRCIKICPHRYLKEYDISIWVDGNIQIKSDLNLFIQKYDLDKTPLYVRKHPNRCCIYDEAIKVLDMHKDSKSIVDKHVKMLLANKYPKKNGLAETNILLRRHSDEACRKVCEDWMSCVVNGSHRDQLSFNYACWKNNFQYGVLDKNPNILDDNDQFFSWLSDHAQKKYLDSSYVTIAICNFNTNDLTNNCIKSIVKNTKAFEYKITVLDNSDKIPFQLDSSIDKSRIEVIDNTHGRFIDFNKMIVSFFNKRSHNNHASAKHCYSIQYLLNICKTKYMVLFDSDTVLRKDIDFIDDNTVTAADIQTRPIDFRKMPYVPRFVPFIQFFNVNLINKLGIKYFDSRRIGENHYGNRIYDTGSSFYDDIVSKRAKYKKINFKAYVDHLNAGSWAKNKSYQCIVAFTTFGSRLSTIERTCKQLADQKTSIDFKICITLDKSDIKRLSQSQKSTMSKYDVEIIQGDNRLRPHNKYFFVMQKYRDLPIITIDDDVKYSDNAIQSLYASYLKFPNCVSALRTHLMVYSGNKICQYKYWKFDYANEKNPSKYLFATGVGGVLYPPNILNITNDDIAMINDSILADDVFLKKKELMLGIDVVSVPHKSKLCPYAESSDKNALSKNGQNFYTNDVVIQKLGFDNI